MGPLGELGALFNPGMRHEIEERQAKANRREEEGNARDGDLRIDLASGVAVINMSKNGDHNGVPAADAALEQHSTQSEAGGSAHDVADGDGATVDAAGLGADEAGLPADEAGLSVASPGDDRSASSASASDHSDAEDPAATAADALPSAAAGSGRPLTAAQARRLATAARRSAAGDRPARPATPRPANAQLPSSKASRAAR